MKSSIGEEIRDIFRFKDNLSILIFLNICIFVVVAAVRLGFYFAGKTFDPTEWLGVSSNFDVLAYRPWTILTYMFVHASFLHILVNLLVLFWFGKIFLEYLSQRQLLGVYVLGGLMGALFFIIAYNIIPVFAPVKDVAFAIGASASIMAVVIAAAVLVPNMVVRVAFIGHFKLKYLAIAIVLVDLLSIPIGNAGGHFAHLGGAFLGFLFARYYARGVDITAFLSRLWVCGGKIFARKKTKIRCSEGDARLETDEEYNMRKANEQKGIDAILDKIRVSGYASLTDEEKELLFKNSKN